MSEVIDFIFFYILNYDFILSWSTLEEDRQVLGFINPVVDSHDEVENIFELQIIFFGVFNTSVNQ